MVSLSYKWKWWTEMFCAFIFGYIGIILLPSNARHTQSVNEICIEIPLTIANFSGSSFSMPIFVSFSLNVLLFASIIQLFKFYWIYFLFRWKWIFFLLYCGHSNLNWDKNKKTNQFISVSNWNSSLHCLWLKHKSISTYRYRETIFSFCFVEYLYMKAYGTV